MVLIYLNKSIDKLVSKRYKVYHIPFGQTISCYILHFFHFVYYFGQYDTSSFSSNLNRFQHPPLSQTDFLSIGQYLTPHCYQQLSCQLSIVFIRIVDNQHTFSRGDLYNDETTSISHDFLVLHFSVVDGPPFLPCFIFRQSREYIRSVIGS